jgi:hypothetical protein
LKGVEDQVVLFRQIHVDICYYLLRVIALKGVFLVHHDGDVTNNVVFYAEVFVNEFLFARLFITKYALKLLFAGDPLIPFYKITDVLLIFVGRSDAYCRSFIYQ